MQKERSVFCAKITTGDGETILAPFVGNPVRSTEEMARLHRALLEKYGFEQGSQYGAYEPTVSVTEPGQTLIPCGIPNSPCSCSGQVEIHVWDADPSLPVTLAHEATHAWRYHLGRTFEHGDAEVDRLIRRAEQEASKR